MTKRTTAECIEWLDRDIKGKTWPEVASYKKHMKEIIRAKLLAADEMAKALEELKISCNRSQQPIIDKALTAYREAGGQ